MNLKELTPDQLSDLKELFVDRYIDNMSAKDLVEYVFTVSYTHLTLPTR